MRPSRRPQFLPRLIAIAITLLSLLIGGEALSLAASVQVSSDGPHHRCQRQPTDRPGRLPGILRHQCRAV